MKVNDKKVDDAINAMIVISIVAAFAGVIIAIWAGIIGLKIAGTGATLFVLTYVLNWIYKQIREERQNEKKSNNKRAV